MLQDWITGIAGVIVIIAAYLSLDIMTLKLVLTILGATLVMNGMWAVTDRSDFDMGVFSKKF